jgi:signal transduction histidine kinase
MHVLITIGTLILEGALIAAAQGLFRLQIPFMPFLISTLAAYIIFLWLKYARQENRRWQAEKKAQYLSELDELKSNFISLMSHDLKTPIAKVQALTERLAREANELKHEHREILEAISKSNDELTNYIVSILNFQKIESQKPIVNRKSNDINALIEEVVNRLDPLAKDKKIELKMELEPMFSAEFDEILIKQVLNNLIENAIKYNGENTQVLVSSGETDDFLFVSIADNGVGIEESQQTRLFKKFSRLEKGTAERVKGTGLGLYLSKYFIELHGGKIEVESKSGEGTKFTFYLPIT